MPSKNLHFLCILYSENSVNCKSSDLNYVVCNLSLNRQKILASHLENAEQPQSTVTILNFMAHSVMRNFRKIMFYLEPVPKLLSHFNLPGYTYGLRVRRLALCTKIVSISTSLFREVMMTSTIDLPESLFYFSNTSLFPRRVEEGSHQDHVPAVWTRLLFQCQHFHSNINKSSKIPCLIAEYQIESIPGRNFSREFVLERFKSLALEHLLQLDSRLLDLYSVFQEEVSNA